MQWSFITRQYHNNLFVITWYCWVVFYSICLPCLWVLLWLHTSCRWDMRKRQKKPWLWYLNYKSVQFKHFQNIPVLLNLQHLCFQYLKYLLSRWHQRFSDYQLRCIRKKMHKKAVWNLTERDGTFFVWLLFFWFSWAFRSLQWNWNDVENNATVTYRSSESITNLFVDRSLIYNTSITFTLFFWPFCQCLRFAASGLFNVVPQESKLNWTPNTSSNS